MGDEILRNRIVNRAVIWFRRGDALGSNLLPQPGRTEPGRTEPGRALALQTGEEPVLQNERLDSAAAGLSLLYATYDTSSATSLAAIK